MVIFSCQWHRSSTRWQQVGWTVVCHNHSVVPFCCQWHGSSTRWWWASWTTMCHNHSVVPFCCQWPGVLQDGDGSAEQLCTITTHWFLFVASDTGVQQDNNRSAEQRRATSATQAGGVGAKSVPSDAASVPHEAGNHGHHQQPPGVACFWGDWFRKNHAGDHRSLLLWKTKVGENYWD